MWRSDRNTKYWELIEAVNHPDVFFASQSLWTSVELLNMQIEEEQNRTAAPGLIEKKHIKLP